VIVVAATVLLCRICPPTVLYCPLKPTPVVRWTVIVIESAVMAAPGLSKRRACSLNHGPLELITGVTVTPPVPPPVTVRAIVVFLVRPPPVPVMVTVEEPGGVPLGTGIVSTLLFPVVEGGLKLGVTPAGNPLALKATLPVNPPVRVIVIVLIPLAPGLIVRLAGLAEIVKFGGASGLTVRLMGMLCVIPPPTPVTVTVAGPVVAVLDAAKVRELEFPVAVAGLKVGVTPAGNPLALNVTLPVNPPVRVIVIETIPLAPWSIARLVGVAASMKSGTGCGLTVRLIVVV